ncbi:MAG: hypothetical protein ABH952_11235 [Candidatus Omnitrophota bacterium]
MKLTVTTNWAEDFLDKVSQFNEVEWIRGRLFKDEVGGQMLLNNFVKHPSRKTLEKTVKKVHAMRKKFSYALNGHCLDNKEYSFEGQTRISQFISWIQDSGVDAVTVVIPHLAEMIKGQFPDLQVELGGAMKLGEMIRLKYFAGLGADMIVLRADWNRHFSLLKECKKNLSCKLKLIVNSLCMFFCNFSYDHENLLSHTSHAGTKIPYCRYYNYLCNQERLKNPAEIIQAGFIRPEDIAVYEAMGYEDFVIMSNSPDTQELIKIVSFYTSRRFDGNLLEIMSLLGEKPFQTRQGKIDKRAPGIDNRQLDGFLSFFQKGRNCHYNVCQTECGYCNMKINTALIQTPHESKAALKKFYEKQSNKIEEGVFA